MFIYNEQKDGLPPLTIEFAFQKSTHTTLVVCVIFRRIPVMGAVVVIIVLVVLIGQTFHAPFTAVADAFDKSVETTPCSSSKVSL